MPCPKQSIKMSATFQQDQLRLIIKPTHAGNEPAFYQKLFSIFSNSFLPEPDQIVQADGVGYPIRGFLDPLVMATLEAEQKSKKNTFELLHVDRENIQVISPTGNIYSLTTFEHLPDPFEEKLRELVIEIVEALQPAYVNCSLDKISRQLYLKHFEWEDRTRFSANLEWLQFFGREEFLRQGGKAIYKNPHIKAETLGDGILIQVGHSPVDAYTELGEKLLVEATQAMPPVSP